MVVTLTLPPRKPIGFGIATSATASKKQRTLFSFGVKTVAAGEPSVVNQTATVALEVLQQRQEQRDARAVVQTIPVV